MDERQHKATKKKLKIFGFILLILGAACMVTGFVDFGLSMNSDSDMPSLFFLIFIGSPMLFIGISLVVFGYKKEITTYVKNESVPVINEAAEELKPAVKSVVGAVKEELQGGETHMVTCPRCGAKNPVGHKFCPECGGSLEKICPECGAKQEADDKFCGNCGAKFE